MTATQFFVLGLLLLSCQGQVSVKQSCALGNWSDCEVETWSPCFTCVQNEYSDEDVEKAYQRYVQDGECADPNDLNCRNFAKMKFLKLTQTYICEHGHCGACFAECTLSCGIPPFQDTETTHAKLAAEYVAQSISYFKQIAGHEEYSYEANVESFTGAHSVTKIWVKNDKIIARKRNSYPFFGNNWLEVGREEVNSHEPLFPSKTAPERIMSCANALNPEIELTQRINPLAETDINKYLDVGDKFHASQLSTNFGVHFMNGCVPILCYTIELGCADDCSTTYSLTNLKFNDPYISTQNSESTINNGACTLTGGEIVQNGWSGSDTGANHCNTCRCDGNILMCTEMYCVGNLNDLVSITSDSTMWQENNGDSDSLPYSPPSRNSNSETEVEPVSNIVLGMTHAFKGQEITVLSCPKNQELTNCGTACPKICGQLEPRVCIELCLTNVCQCPGGLWLDSTTGICVEQRNCPRKPTPMSQYLQSSVSFNNGETIKETLMNDVWFWCFLATFALTCCAIAFVGCYKKLLKTNQNDKNNTPFLPKSGDVILDEDFKPTTKIQTIDFWLS